MSTSSNSSKNRLNKAKSPYLLQHEDNPVAWYEWGPEAFAASKEQDKPVLLSVGYAACHWCHVMAHESFEDETVAEIMNKHFISVKVDREERPDIDRVYMSYLQATSGRGGWPATYFLTPELTPIFAGTYFPKPTFLDLMKQVSTLWSRENTRKRIRAQGDDVMRQLKDVSRSQSSSSSAGIDVLGCMDKIYRHWQEDYDSEFGGFGDAPKFPSPSLTFVPLLRHAVYSKNGKQSQKAIDMSIRTLSCIDDGGIHDHIGHGISRYSVDETWLLPHFEKMLYDNAQLLTSAIEAALLADKVEDKIKMERMAAGIVAYLEQDLQNKEGGFFCAEDADSLPGNGETEKKEGAFYVWTYEQLQAILGKDLEVFATHFGVEKNGNAPGEHDIQGELAGTNVLARKTSIVDLAKRFGMSVSDVRQVIDRSCDKLRAFRAKHRPRPHLDDKILTAWNGLAISALAKVADHSFYDASEHPEHAARPSELANINQRALKMAEDAVRFLKANLWDAGEKRLHRSFREGKGPHAQADDYAFLIMGLLDLFESTGKEEYLVFAAELQERQDELFYDDEEGGYFASPVGDPYVLIRMKEHQEGAEPSAMAVSVANLYRLAHLLDDKRDDFAAKAQACVLSASSLLQRAPFAMGTLTSNALLDEEEEGIKQIIVTGSLSDGRTQHLLAVIRKIFIPNRLLILLSPETPQDFLSSRNEVIRSLVEGGQHKDPAVRLCEGRVCGLPVTDVNKLEQALAGESKDM